MEILGALFVILWIVAQIVAKARSGANEQGTPVQPRGTPGTPGEAEDELRRFLESLSGGAPRTPQPKPPAPAVPPPGPQRRQPAMRTPARRTPPAPAAPAPQPQHRIERTRPAPAPRRQPAAPQPVRRPMPTLREAVAGEPAAPPPLPVPRTMQPPAVDEAQLLRDGLSSALFGSRQPRYGVASVGIGRGRRNALLKGFKSRTGLRRAVIAREILGPPIALRRPEPTR